MERIHWAAKISQEMLWELYQGEAGGMLDEELLAEVGQRLYERCRSMSMVTRGEIECPRCGRVFVTAESVGEAIRDPEKLYHCPAPGCGWEISAGHYHATWRHQDLLGRAALAAIDEYLEQYPRASAPEARMLCIDRLIQAFHWSLQNGLPNRSLASCLIAGSHREVVALLDRLFAGDDSPDLQAWRKTVRAMFAHRTGKG